MIFLPVFTCVSKNIWFDHIIFKKLAKIFMQMLDGFKEIYRYQVYPDFILLRMIDIGHMGRGKWSSSFWTMYPSQKSYVQEKLLSKWKKYICKILHQKRIQKVLIKNWWNGGCFLNLANFTQLAFFTLLPPSHYTLN